MDEEIRTLLRSINSRVGETNKKLGLIKDLLIVSAIFAFLAGRSAVIEHGFWKLIGF